MKNELAKLTDNSETDKKEQKTLSIDYIAEYNSNGAAVNPRMHKITHIVQ